MDEKTLPIEDEKENKVSKLKPTNSTKEDAVVFINQQFGVAKSVALLHKMSEGVIEKNGMTPQAVHAAVACVGKLNETLREVIGGADFLSKK